MTSVAGLSTHRFSDAQRVALVTFSGAHRFGDEPDGGKFGASLAKQLADLGAVRSVNGFGYELTEAGAAMAEFLRTSPSERPRCPKCGRPLVWVDGDWTRGIEAGFARCEHAGGEG